MGKKGNDKSGKYREIAVLSIVPCIVGILITASWALSHWKIGPYFLNAGLALFATLGGGYTPSVVKMTKI
jgi:predicted signal transduction protein with EAL and GGDEF domain